MHELTLSRARREVQNRTGGVRVPAGPSRRSAKHRPRKKVPVNPAALLHTAVPHPTTLLNNNLIVSRRQQLADMAENGGASMPHSEVHYFNRYVGKSPNLMFLAVLNFLQLQYAIPTSIYFFILIITSRSSWNSRRNARAYHPLNAAIERCD